MNQFVHCLKEMNTLQNVNLVQILGAFQGRKNVYFYKCREYFKSVSREKQIILVVYQINLFAIHHKGNLRLYKNNDLIIKINFRYINPKTQY